MDYIIVFALGIITAVLLIRAWARAAITKVLKQLEADTQQLADAHLRVNLEFDHDVYFLYNSDDGSFVAQGSDFTELKRNLISRFPNRSVLLVKGDATALEKLQQQISGLDKIIKDKTAT